MADPAPPPRVSDDPGSLRQRVVDLLEYLYGPLIVSVGFFFLYGFADPAQEALFGIANDFARLNAGPGPDGAGPDLLVLVRAGYGLFGPLLMTYALWVAARFVLQIYDVPPSPARDRLLVAVPLLPSLAMVIGPVRAALSPEARASTELLGLPAGVLAEGDLRLPLLYLALPGVLACLLIATYFYARWDAARGNAGAARAQDWLERLLDLEFPLARLLGVVGVAAISGVAILGIWDMRFGEWAGPIGVATSFAAALGLLLAGLSAASRVMPGRFPLLVVVLLLALGLSSPWLAAAILAAALVTLACWRRLTVWGRAFALVLAGVQGTYIVGGWLSDACDTLAGCNMVQPMAGAPYDFTEGGTVIASRSFRSDVASPSASLGFELWNRRRLALQARDGEPRPIRVVAAQGGGLYAAYQTAWYLAHRADTEPGFAASVFAISGVSGGSVGGGVFWAIRASGVCDGPRAGTDCHRRGVRAVLEHDFLSPALTGLFFRDAIDSVVPISALVRRPVDRGQGLERTLADRLADWIEDETGRPPATNPLHLAMSRSWSPDAGLPLLLMNATDVASGGLTVLSPVRDVTLNVPGRLRLPEAGDVPVVTGMVTSARFPLVSPPLRVRVEEPDPAGPPGTVRVVTRQLVDGGYFDNSGLETLADLLPLMVLRRDRAEPGARPPIEVIVFTVAEGRDPLPPPVKGTFAAPLAAFTGAWRSRRDLTVRRIEGTYAAAAAGACFIPARMSETRVNFTVSWYLADATFAAIREEMARAAAERGTCPPV